MIVEFAGEAENDLEQIANVIAERSPVGDLSFIGELRTRCEDFIANPNAFALVPRYEHRGVRRRIIGNDLIFYRVDNEKVVIIHILHGATDYGAIVFGE